MIERVTTIEVRERLGDLLNRVALRQDAFIIERRGKALAAMVSVEKLDQLERMAHLCLLGALDGDEPSLSEEQAERLADEAKHRARKGAE